MSWLNELRKNKPTRHEPGRRTRCNNFHRRINNRMRSRAKSSSTPPKYLTKQQKHSQRASKTAQSGSAQNLFTGGAKRGGVFVKHIPTKENPADGRGRETGGVKLSTVGLMVLTPSKLLEAFDARSLTARSPFAHCGVTLERS